MATGTDPENAPAPGSSLVDEVRRALRLAGDLYAGTPHAEPLRDLAQRHAGPLRLVLAGGPGAGASTLADALALGPEPSTSATVVDGSGMADPLDPGDPVAAVADAAVLLLRPGRPDDAALRPRSFPTIAVLARADEVLGSALLDPAAVERVAAECAARPGSGGLGVTALPVSGLLARAAAVPRETDHWALVRLATCPDEELDRVLDGPGVAVTPPAVLDGSEVTLAELVARYGPVGVRSAVTLVRSGRAPLADALAAALHELSGLPRLRELVEARFVRRAASLTARSGLRALDALVRRDPPPGGGRSLRYLLERIRLGSDELAEADLLDALWAGKLGLRAEECRAAETLLGGAGCDARSRLSLAADAGEQDVAESAAAQLERWRRRAAHPLSTEDVRVVGRVLVRICRELAGPDPEPPTRS